MSYQFIDANSSIIVADSSIVSGSGLTGTQRPIVNIGSTLSSVPVTFSGSPSISGAVTIVGNPSISGTVNLGISPSVYGNISGSVLAYQAGGWNTSITSIRPSSVLVGASIFGQLPAGTAVLGSVLTLQGTNPWNISSIYGNISGSVLSQQLGTHISSVVGSIPSSLLSGVYGHRNDAVASFLGGNLSWNPVSTDSAGRTLIRPFAAEESRVEGYISLTSTSVTTLVAAAGAGLRNYITDAWFANTGASATLVTMTSNGGASTLGYTIVPAGGGSNLPGLTTPIRTGANETFGIQAGTATSTLYATVKGFKAP